MSVVARDLSITLVRPEQAWLEASYHLTASPEEIGLLPDDTPEQATAKATRWAVDQVRRGLVYASYQVKEVTRMEQLRVSEIDLAEEPQPIAVEDALPSGELVG